MDWRWGLGVLALFLVGGLGLVWFWSGQGAGDATEPVALQHVENVSFKANRGPFTLVIDGMTTYRSDDSPLGPMWILVPSLAIGRHDFTATSSDGQVVTLKEALASPSIKSFFFFLPLVGPEPEPLGSDPVIEATRGTLVLTSTPPGASVVVGIDNKGVTPLTLSLEPGFSLIWVLMQCYKPVNLSTKIEAGKVFREHLVLEPGTTVLTFSGKQAGSVLLDGTLLVDLPTLSKKVVPSGVHVITVVDEAAGTRREEVVELLAGDVFTVRGAEP